MNCDGKLYVNWEREREGGRETDEKDGKVEFNFLVAMFLLAQYIHQMTRKRRSVPKFYNKSKSRNIHNKFMIFNCYRRIYVKVILTDTIASFRVVGVP